MRLADTGDAGEAELLPRGDQLLDNEEDMYTDGDDIGTPAWMQTPASPERQTDPGPGDLDIDERAPHPGPSTPPTPVPAAIEPPFVEAVAKPTVIEPVVEPVVEPTVAKRGRTRASGRKRNAILTCCLSCPPNTTTTTTDPSPPLCTRQGSARFATSRHRQATQQHPPPPTRSPVDSDTGVVSKRASSSARGTAVTGPQQQLPCNATVPTSTRPHRPPNTCSHDHAAPRSRARAPAVARSIQTHLRIGPYSLALWTPIAHRTPLAPRPQRHLAHDEHPCVCSSPHPLLLSLPFRPALPPSRSHSSLRSHSPSRIRSHSPSRIRSYSPSRIRSHSPSRIRSYLPSRIRSHSQSLAPAPTRPLASAPTPNLSHPLPLALSHPLPLSLPHPLPLSLPHPLPLSLPHPLPLPLASAPTLSQSLSHRSHSHPLSLPIFILRFAL
ncbi:hypothetical protein BJ912DRAFT_1065317 [Pholiota molesta]|nr:hypothetical protein BJ912DRAFT_1065317 [Pholiota molesta]